MDYQIYSDGVDFEGSVNYHRLALEAFSVAAILLKANDIAINNHFFVKLFKMFEYAAAYIDETGNAPQIGDNDNSRMIIFYQSSEGNHSYLLDLGKHIFDYRFTSQCQRRISAFAQWLPKINKVKISELNVAPKPTDKSIAFERGGAYILKNEFYSVFISCFPIGQNGKGGHNHLDSGSFTFTYRFYYEQLFKRIIQLGFLQTFKLVLKLFLRR